MAEQQRLTKEIEQQEQQQAYQQREHQLKQGREQIRKRQDELAVKAMAARDKLEETTPHQEGSVNSAQPPPWVNALSFKIDNFLKTNAAQVLDDGDEEQVKKKKKPAPVLDEEIYGIARY